MEAIQIINNSPGQHWKEVMTSFFQQNSPESIRLLFWRMFQCWVTKDCTVRNEVSDQEVALTFDQLLELVSAAYTLHQDSNTLTEPTASTSHE